MSAGPWARKRLSKPGLCLASSCLEWDPHSCHFLTSFILPEPRPPRTSPLPSALTPVSLQDRTRSLFHLDKWAE